MGVAVLEGSDAAMIEEEQKNLAHCPLPILDHKTRALLSEPFSSLPSKWQLMKGEQDGFMRHLQLGLSYMVLGYTIAEGAGRRLAMSKAFKYGKLPILLL